MKRAVALLLCACLTLLCGCAPREGAQELTAVFFDVGKGDAILLYTAQSAVLIDAGYDKDGETLLAQMHSRGVERLDALIVTHFDKDHVGGADKILAGMEVARVFEPAYEKDAKQYRQYREALEAAGIVPETLEENVRLTLDGCVYQIDVANQADYKDDQSNNFSLVVRVDHGEVRFLLAATPRTRALASFWTRAILASDVLKAPHHGRWADLTAAFVAAVSPQYAVVTSSEEEPEDERTLAALDAAGATVLLTREGEVELVSDGAQVRPAA